MPPLFIQYVVNLSVTWSHMGSEANYLYGKASPGWSRGLVCASWACDCMGCVRCCYTLSLTHHHLGTIRWSPRRPIKLFSTPPTNVSMRYVTGFVTGLPRVAGFILIESEYRDPCNRERNLQASRTMLYYPGNRCYKVSTEGSARRSWAVSSSWPQTEVSSFILILHSLKRDSWLLFWT